MAMPAPLAALLGRSSLVGADAMGDPMSDRFREVETLIDQEPDNTAQDGAVTAGMERLCRAACRALRATRRWFERNGRRWTARGERGIE
jgi:hypothetical protein